MASVPAVYLSRLGPRFPNSLLLSIPILRENLGTRVRPVSIASNMAETNGLGSGRGSGATSVSTASNGGGGWDAHGVVRFPLSPSSALIIQKGDITLWFADGSSDAIVNPANQRMLGGGGADGAIHTAAGPELRAACYNVPEVRPGVRCPTGEARITPGFRLPASHVIHTVGPIYNADGNPEASLRSAYRSSLCLAKENNIQYIAFPAISCGVYRYPFEEAATVAISTVSGFADDFKEVHFVLFSDDIYSVWLDKANELLQDQ
ncbi:Macro domain-containing protein [Actinidia chinensis var. chinensis]|uniref:Macro domain-containing protein n=1 Tax=Actinidia chinensis var. chinensis TaxID=1590841 RepID=A0A2R6PLP2_ACTCC|nr:Macro domain-containing protein [Actinidia chinensis var. chinensis]